MYNLHWLLVNLRIRFKVLLFVFEAIHGLAPSYISDLILVKPKSSVHRSNVHWTNQKSAKKNNHSSHQESAAITTHKETRSANQESGAAKKLPIASVRKSRVDL